MGKGRKSRRKLRIAGKIIGVLLILVFIAIAGVGALIGYLTLREYDPADVEEVRLEEEGSKTLSVGDSLSILTFNTGYAALDADHDFFMDGGSDVNCDSPEIVKKNVAGISNIIKDTSADVVFLQEVDIDSKRSANVNQSESYYAIREDDSHAYAANFRCDFIPYPFPEFIGKVECGLVTLNTLAASEAERIALPTTFTWPMRICQLKRCLLMERIPIEGSDKELVLVNLHLEAYDDGDAKVAQTKVLANVLKSEYAKGNYCIAGGDFNQTFPSVDPTLYPVKNDEFFKAGVLDITLFDEGWNFPVDSTTPSARLLNEPYDPSNPNTQYYVLDGFITSPNVQVNRVETLDKEFTYSDHNPVLLNVTLLSPADMTIYEDTSETGLSGEDGSDAGLSGESTSDTMSEESAS